MPLPPDELDQGRLLLQGTSLPLSVRIVEGEPRVLAPWPRCGTGNYRLVLELREVVTAEAIVTIRPQKISEKTYLALINELQGDALPTSIALALERTGGLAGVRLEARADTTMTQELLRLRRAVEGTEHRIGLARALIEIARDPYRVLRKTELWVRAEHVRRLEPAGIVRALRQPENLDPQTRKPRLVPDVRVEHTYNVYENRLLRLFVAQVDLRLRRLNAAFRENNQLAGIAQVEELQDSLAMAVRAATFLQEVDLPGAVARRPTMVLLHRSLYRAVFEGFLEFHREAYVELDDSSLDEPLDNLPHLYETWGALEVIAAVLNVGEELGFQARLQRIARHTENSVFIKVIPDGQPALVLTHPDDNISVRVTPQRSFRRSSGRFRSISFSQRPDITVEVGRAGGQTVLLFFDPKYKLRSEGISTSVDDDSLEGPAGQPKKIDIDKMHAYRDAIRGRDLERVVRYAAILYPGPTVRYDGRVAALSALPGAAAGLRREISDVVRRAVQTE